MWWFLLCKFSVVVNKGTIKILFNFNDYNIKVLNLDIGGFEYSKVVHRQISQEINKSLEVIKTNWKDLKKGTSVTRNRLSVNTE